MKLYKNTDKFWDFKHTRYHNKLKKGYIKEDVIRYITLTKSFLLEIYKEEENEVYFVIPYKFVSTKWPYGYYNGISENGRISFSDKDIKSIII